MPGDECTLPSARPLVWRCVLILTGVSQDLRFFWLLWLPETSTFSSDTYVQAVGCFVRDYFLNICLLFVFSLWTVL